MLHLKGVRLEWKKKAADHRFQNVKTLAIKTGKVLHGYHHGSHEDQHMVVCDYNYSLLILIFVYICIL